MNVQGIVLAGGKSIRFQEDKALFRLRGITLLEHAVNLLSGLGCDPVVMTAAGRDYSFLNRRIEKDAVPERGPLGGLHTAFAMFPGRSLLVLTCDMPNLTPEVLNTLLDRHDARKKVTLFDLRSGFFQPFPGVYEGSLRDLVRACLAAGERSLQQFLLAVPEKQLLAPEFPPSVFANVNTPDDLKAVSNPPDTKSGK